MLKSSYFERMVNMKQRPGISLLVFLTICCLVFTTNPAFSSEESHPYWVFLRDHDGAVTDISHLDPYAIERRLVRGIHGDGSQFDLPVADRYKEAILAIPGVSLRGESRWLNALSIKADSAALQTITAFPFVHSTQPVARMKTTSRLDDIESMTEYRRATVNERWGEYDQLKGTQPDPDAPYWRSDRAWYGPSLNQVRQTNALEAHYRGNHGHGIRIVVLDGGYQLGHEAFRHLDVIAQYDFINDDDDCDYDPTQDRRGQPAHGTGCMSVIGGYMPGNLIGLAHEASFILCKTEDTSNETVVEEDNWVRAVEWAESLGADVLSSSLSYQKWYELSDYDGEIPITSRAAQIAYELGMILCTSAGNEGPGAMTIGAPTDAEGVLSIGAVRPNGDLAGFSSRGPTADGRIKPDVCGQGVRVAAVRPGSWDRYAFWNGTSLSCPVVAGCMALLLADHPDWTPAQIYEATRETASHAERPDNDWGWGLINLEEAIHYPSISGWITDSDGIGMGGIKLQLFGEEETLRVVSGEYGFYRFSNLKWGTVRLQVVWKDGGTSAFETIVVPPSEEVDFLGGD
ncbi:hypothetical protein CEE37_09715 [candidate division LCP-89 bacterium B3_LCP]|uniref:Peptidase S8/S53 domain-containing protein n=1 Tax=candidate division LCP-89 bacterium B3_LCP TaxID=2012998 RepID=A0A532UYH0_UNCL8|nr:MAG: hypothetical protein CEE37_09715 [candidate division LCP-89 bacterium B3_LCP]